MHVMVDIETLGIAPGSAILSIGAVAFDPAAGTFDREFACNIDLASAVACGLRIDPATLTWWMGQGEAARQAAFLAEPRLPLPFALMEFSRAFGPFAGRSIWGHGATFDPVLLACAYEACGHRVPWTFREVRDTRTLFDLAGIPTLAPYRQAEDEHHTPLSDAKVQARAVIDAYRRLNVMRAAQPAPGTAGAPSGAAQHALAHHAV